MNQFDPNKTYLVTGAAGFIGYHLSKRILENGGTVVGYDNLNDYYDVNLKKYRLSFLEKFDKFTFVHADLADKTAMDQVFEKYHPQIVINLAAQAGVRYSIEHPECYIQSNVVGFANILECCRHNNVEHLVYASSSSVYGGNTKIPFSTTDQVDRPISLYAATKKSNELMAYSYSKLYGMATTGLRFFTVYGPMGRPDMACYKFALKMIKGEPIQLYNGGDMWRDFTYVDDIVTGIYNILNNAPKPDDLDARYKVYNIGNHKSEKLMDFVGILEDKLGIVAKKELLPMQAGDVYKTYADVDDLIRDFDFRPNTTIEEGLDRFTKWFKEYHNVK